MAPDMIDLAMLGGQGINGLDALGEVRRGVIATGSDENSAIVWLYVGLLLGARFPATASATVDVLRRTALMSGGDALDRAVVGIARAAGDRTAD